MSTVDEIPAPLDPAVSWKVRYPEPLPQLVRHDANDQLLHISMQLAAELWVVKRRLAEVEAQLVAGGAILSPDHLTRDPDFRFDNEERDRFVRRVFGALLNAETSAE